MMDFKNAGNKILNAGIKGSKKGNGCSNAVNRHPSMKVVIILM